MEQVISIQNLTVLYKIKGIKTRLHKAVDGLSFDVARGEVFGFLGPNGAGKTTTIKVLLGFIKPTEGVARIFDINTQEPIARQRIGYLPEQTDYYQFLTAEELLWFYAKIFKIPKAEARLRIDSVLKLVELDGVRNKLIRTYSKGMQQRIGIAQALINEPDLLILDEPTSGLDPIGRMKVRQIIQRLKNEGRTVFFSSHELGEVETVCDRVLILAEGKLRAMGSVAELTTKYHGNLEKAFLEIVGWHE